MEASRILSNQLNSNFWCSIENQTVACSTQTIILLTVTSALSCAFIAYMLKNCGNVENRGSNITNVKVEPQQQPNLIYKIFETAVYGIAVGVGGSIAVALLSGLTPIASTAAVAGTTTVKIAKFFMRS